MKHREQVDVEMSGLNRDHPIAAVARSSARFVGRVEGHELL
jgi:hypothetical protein